MTIHTVIENNLLLAEAAPGEAIRWRGELHIKIHGNRNGDFQIVNLMNGEMLTLAPNTPIEKAPEYYITNEKQK